MYNYRRIDKINTLGLALREKNEDHDRMKIYQGGMLFNREIGDEEEPGKGGRLT